MEAPIKIENLTDYFAQMRLRPGMYLGENTITKLYDHLQGYHMACWFNNIDNPVDKKFFDDFNDFVCAYYGEVSHAGWKGILLEQSFDNEQAALANFFELYDLFIEGVKPINTKEIVLAFFDKLVYQQDEMKEKLGDDFSAVLGDTVELVKENVMTNLKDDYDYIFAQLKEKAERIPEMKELLTSLKMQ